MEQLIDEFDKNAREQVRVSLTEYQGHDLVDLRVYYQDDKGQFRPTRKGLCLSFDTLPRLKTAVEKADTTVRELQASGELAPE